MVYAYVVQLLLLRGIAVDGSSSSRDVSRLKM